MKLLRITTAYSVYIEGLYQKKIIQADKPYSEQYAEYCKDSFGWADFWSNAFQKLGFECWEPVSNIELLQKKWAFENGIKFQEANWLYEIQTAQAKKFQPDILFINDYYTFSYEYIQFLRNTIPSIKYIIGWCGAPFEDTKVFKAYDLLLTNLPAHQKYFSENGTHCKLMKHAFDPRILERIQLNPKKNQFTFLGSIVIGKGFHNERVELIKFLLKETNLELYSDLNPSSFGIYQRESKKYVYKKILDFLLPNNLKDGLLNKLKIDKNIDLIFKNYHPKELVKKAKPGLFGLEMYQTLSDSKITLNQHIDISKGSSNNMRLYEATGVGTCLLTDWSEDLNDKFIDGEEVVAYKSKEELLEKIKYLNNNPPVAESIAKKGQERTLRENSFSKRAIEINEIIQKEI
jgi:spore maturation protein CgeB